MSYMIIGRKVTKQGGEKLENWLFNFYFLNQNISLNINFPIIKFHIHIENIWMEGTVSQILYLGPSFDFMKSRKIIMQKKQNSSRFFYIKLKPGPISKF